MMSAMKKEHQDYKVISVTFPGTSGRVRAVHAAAFSVDIHKRRRIADTKRTHIIF